MRTRNRVFDAPLRTNAASQRVCAHDGSCGSILSKKGSQGWCPRAARGKDSSRRLLSANSIQCAPWQGTRFYPPTISSVARSTFSTVSVRLGSRRPRQDTSALPHKAAQLSYRATKRSFQGTREAAQIQVSQQSDLPPGQFLHGTLLVGQHNCACASTDRKPRPGRAVDACDIRWPPDVAHPSVQHGLRTAENEPVIQPAGRQRVVPAAKVEGAAAAGSTDDPPSLVDGERHCPAVGIAGGGRADESNERNQCSASGR